MAGSFLQHFEAIEDPRIDRCKRHELLNIILLTISAVLSRAEGWEQIEDFGVYLWIGFGAIALVNTVFQVMIPLLV